MANLRINDDKDIFDIALETHGDISYAIKIVKDNNENVSDISANLSGIHITYDDTIKDTITPVKRLTTPIKINQDFEGKDGQSLFDLSLQLYGNLEDVYKIIRENELESINRNIVSGLNYSFTYSKTSFNDFLNLNDIIINTSDPKIKTGKAFISSAFKRTAFS